MGISYLCCKYFRIFKFLYTPLIVLVTVNILEFLAYFFQLFKCYRELRKQMELKVPILKKLYSNLAIYSYGEISLKLSLSVTCKLTYFRIVQIKTKIPLFQISVEQTLRNLRIFVSHETPSNTRESIRNVTLFIIPSSSIYDETVHLIFPNLVKHMAVSFCSRRASMNLFSSYHALILKFITLKLRSRTSLKSANGSLTDYREHLCCVQISLVRSLACNQLSIA